MKQFAEIFLITIFAELAAIVLLTIVGGFFSRKARWIFTVIFGRILDIDVEHVFRGKHEADEDISAELARASFVYLLTGRGSELQRETFSGALRLGPHAGKARFRVLLPESNSRPNEPDWTNQREQELAGIDHAFGGGVLRDQIETTAKFLSGYTSAGNVELKRFSYPHIGRILITDKVVYFTPYRRDAHGRDSSIIKYRRGGEMYDWFLRIFTQLWENNS